MTSESQTRPVALKLIIGAFVVCNGHESLFAAWVGLIYITVIRKLLAYFFFSKFLTLYLCCDILTVKISWLKIGMIVYVPHARTVTLTLQV